MKNLKSKRKSVKLSKVNMSQEKRLDKSKIFIEKRDDR